MEHCEVIRRTSPPPSPKGHHLNLFTPNNIKGLKTTTKKPLWLEFHWILPNPRIPPHLCHHEVHSHIFRHQIIIQNHVLRHCMWHQKSRPPSRHDVLNLPKSHLLDTATCSDLPLSLPYLFYHPALL